LGKEDSAGVTGGTAIENECDICGGDSYSAAELFNLDLKILLAIFNLSLTALHQ